MVRILLMVLVFFISCRHKNDREEKPSILSLREMSDLATVEYTVTKVIKASDNQTWFKMGDRKILMSCEAHIKAGIDMQAINTNSFNIKGKNIEVTLPEPKIISLSLPAEGIKTEFEEVGTFRDKFKSSDRDALAAQAEMQIRNNIESLGILSQAKVNTGVFITNFLKRMGYENIVINYGTGKIPNAFK